MEIKKCDTVVEFVEKLEAIEETELCMRNGKNFNQNISILLHPFLLLSYSNIDRVDNKMSKFAHFF